MQTLNEVGDSPNSRSFDDHSDCQSLETIPHYYSSDNSPTSEFYPPLPEQKFQPPVIPDICHGNFLSLYILYVRHITSFDINFFFLQKMKLTFDACLRI